MILDGTVVDVVVTNLAHVAVTVTDVNVDVAPGPPPHTHDTVGSLHIGDDSPTPPTGVSVLWVDTTGGDLTLNLVTGD